MPRAATVRQADINRAVAALRAAGVGVARVVIRPGEVEIIPGLLNPAPPREGDALSEWRARKDARRAAERS